MDIYGNELDLNTTENKERFYSLVNELVVQVSNPFSTLTIDQEIHFFRNKINRAPNSLNELIKLNQILPREKRWKLLPPEQAAFHMNGEYGEFNLKFVSYDEHFEAVYNKNGVLLTEENDAINMGTYNYFGPNNNAGNHIKLDVKPYYEWGNTSTSGTDGEAGELAKAAVNLIKYNANPEAKNNYSLIRLLSGNGF
ncbi:MAG: hypothetical protein BWY74_03121 [Firmicutes bacterium ADurb.Bin419]|nr:MAG: hypothetical protein BWY74_03121 [Firmicutes bacterium ADurb.Bin419]